jgi:hypothetical protein
LDKSPASRTHQFSVIQMRACEMISYQTIQTNMYQCLENEYLDWVYFRFLRYWQPLWSSGPSSWLQIQRCGFDSRRYQIFWEVVGLERGPLSLVSTIEELPERKSRGSGLEIREYGRRDPSCWPRGTPHPQKLALTSPTSGGRSVGIVRSRTHATATFSIEPRHWFTCVLLRHT